MVHTLCIEQAPSVKMAGNWSRSFFPHLRTETRLDRLKFHKLAKKKKFPGQYPAILTKHAWLIKDNMWEIFPERQSRKSQVSSCLLSYNVANHSTGFGSSCLLMQQVNLIKLSTKWIVQPQALEGFSFHVYED